MDHAAKSDEELLLAYYHGQDRALDEFVEQCLSRLRAASRHLVRQFLGHGRLDLAEVAVQETVLRVVATKNAPSKWNPDREGASRVWPWISAILHNVVASLIRDEGTRHRLCQRAQADPGGAGCDKSAPEPAVCDDPSSALETEEQLQVLRDGIAVLPERQWLVIELELLGLSRTEIAEELGTSTSTVCRWVGQAHKHLRSRLQERHLLQESVPTSDKRST